MESHLEARLWNDAFVFAQDRLGIPQGSIRATVLIETHPAAFEMEEILYELRDHSAGLNAGRWDYMFITVLPHQGRALRAARPELGDHDRAVHAPTPSCSCGPATSAAPAIGGMAAFIPSKDEQTNERAFAKVRDDKTQEAGDGFDGSWVAHPGMVALCTEVFTPSWVTPRPARQAARRRRGERRSAPRRGLDAGRGHRGGLRSNVSVGLQYLESWLRAPARWASTT